MQSKLCKFVVLPLVLMGVGLTFAAGCGSGDSAEKKEALKASPKGDAKKTVEPQATTEAQ